MLFLFSTHQANASTIHEYRDTITNSAPSEYSNHAIEFITTVAIPAGGFVRFTPDDGDFTIPTLAFDFKNVELAVATSSGYVNRSATGTADAIDDGVAIVSGSSGQIEVTLNSSVGIPVNARVRLRIGNNTTHATSTDFGILNPSTIGTYAFLIEAGTSGATARSRGLIAIVDSVSVGPIDTKEFVPPERFNGAPSGALSGTTQQVQMSLETNEFSRCRYGTATNTPYFSIGNEFTSTFATVHAVAFTVSTSTSYTFFIRCIDDEGNINTDDYVISFIIPPFPVGVPGEDDNEGEGTEGGSGSGGSGGGGGGGSGGGAGTEAGDGGGGFEGTGNAYQSGDGRVIINGYAFPRSAVYILVDGVVADTITADGSGNFSVTLDKIARGVYTFGVYAVDRQNVRSGTFSTTFTVTGARGSTLSNINVMPSIKVTPNPVTSGQTLIASGYAIPNAVVTLENQQDKSSVSLKSYTTNSDSTGAWSVSIDTTGFKNGTYKMRAKAKQDTGNLVQTNFSGYTFYGVGQSAEVPRNSDLNRDGKVNLTDFSILLF